MTIKLENVTLDNVSGTMNLDLTPTSLAKIIKDNNIDIFELLKALGYFGIRLFSEDDIKTLSRFSKVRDCYKEDVIFRTIKYASPKLEECADEDWDVLETGLKEAIKAIVAEIGTAQKDTDIQSNNNRTVSTFHAMSSMDTINKMADLTMGGIPLTMTSHTEKPFNLLDEIKHLDNSLSKPNLAHRDDETKMADDSLGKLMACATQICKEQMVHDIIRKEAERFCGPYDIQTAPFAITYISKKHPGDSIMYNSTINKVFITKNQELLCRMNINCEKLIIEHFEPFNGYEAFAEYNRILMALDKQRRRLGGCQ